MVSRSAVVRTGKVCQSPAGVYGWIGTEIKLSHRLSFVEFQLPVWPAMIAMTDSIVGRSPVPPTVEGVALW